MGAESNLTSRLLTLDEVSERCALSRSTIYRMLDSETLPRPIKIGERAVRWHESEIDDFIASRPRSQ